MTLPEDREYFSSPSVYRGKSASKQEQTESLLVVCRARADSRLLAGSIPQRGEGVLKNDLSDSPVHHLLSFKDLFNFINND